MRSTTWYIGLMILFSVAPRPCVSVTTGVARADSASLGLAIGKAVGFLAENQMRHGEFRTYASTDSTLLRMLHFDSSPFVTSFVVYSLGFVSDPRVEAIIQRALRFLAGEMDRGGTWRYWTSLNDKAIDPDLDDTACISFLLRRHLIHFPPNLSVFYDNMDGSGRFKTWVRPLGSTTPNDVDCVVNANVLLYLGSNPKTRAACNYVNGVIARGVESRSTVYYLHNTAFYYMLSRASVHGASCLAASRDTVLARTKAFHNEDGSLGDELATAFGICTMLNFDAAPDTTLDAAVRYLLRRQRASGSWPISAFYAARKDGVWWGSEEMTTAICLEALARYQTVMKVDAP